MIPTVSDGTDKNLAGGLTPAFFMGTQVKSKDKKTLRRLVVVAMEAGNGTKRPI